HITALDPELTRRPNPEATADLAAQQSAEDGGAVEAREAQPIQRAIARDESRGATISDHRVVADRWVACGHHEQIVKPPTGQTAGGWCPCVLTMRSRSVRTFQLVSHHGLPGAVTVGPLEAEIADLTGPGESRQLGQGGREHLFVLQ